MHTVPSGVENKNGFAMQESTHKFAFRWNLTALRTSTLMLGAHTNIIEKSVPTSNNSLNMQTMGHFEGGRKRSSHAVIESKHEIF
jgi:hypothetical protein